MSTMSAHCPHLGVDVINVEISMFINGCPHVHSIFTVPIGAIFLSFYVCIYSLYIDSFSDFGVDSGHAA